MTTSRRTFLVATGKVMVLLPAGYAFANVAGCGSSNNANGGNCDTANEVVDNNTTLTVTSECVGDHAHSFSVQDSDVATPPAAGVSGNTTTVESHMHTVALTSADLQSIAAGNTVTKESGTTDGHTHTFNFSKTASAPVQQPISSPGY